MRKRASILIASMAMALTLAPFGAPAAVAGPCDPDYPCDYEPWRPPTVKEILCDIRGGC